MAFAVFCLTPTASGIATAQEQRGPTRLMPVQVPAGFAAGPLQPDVSQIMIRQLRQASESAAGNCLGDMRQTTVAAPSKKTAAEFQSNADLRQSGIVALGRRTAPNDLLLLYSLTGIGKADIYQGQPQIAAEFRYRLVDVQADTVLHQASHFSERLQGRRCDPAKLSPETAEAERQTAISCFEDALSEAFPELMGDAAAQILSAARCAPVPEGPTVTVVVDRNWKDALRPVYYEDAMLEGLLTAGGQSDADMSYFTVRQADTDLSSEFLADDEEAKTSEEDIESAARSLAGRSAYLLVYQPRATAKTEPFTGLAQLGATIDYRLYDIDKQEFVADDSVEIEDEYLTGCATTIAGQSSDPLCIKAFVAERLRTLANELGRGLAVNLARRQQAQ